MEHNASVAVATSMLPCIWGFL